jgi:hypothetical protein
MSRKAALLIVGCGRRSSQLADANHLRELLLIGRPPESWIPPADILDLRVRVRTRHLLSRQRIEWQQRIHSVLYPTASRSSATCSTLEKREWLAALTLRRPGADHDRAERDRRLDLKLVFDRDLRALWQTGWLPR